MELGKAKRIDQSSVNIFYNELRSTLNYYDQLEMFVKFNITSSGTDELRLIQCPVLIVHGSQDETISQKEWEQAIKEYSVKVDLKIIEGAGHLFPIETERPKAQQIIIEWLASLEKAGSVSKASQI